MVETTERVDSAAHRHPRAAHRRAGRGDVGHRRAGGARGHRRKPGITPERHRLHRRRHDDARHDLSEHGVHAAGEDRRGQRVGLRPRRGLFGVHVLADASAIRWWRPARVEHALVVGADVMSSIIDYTDRATCMLFGDGAGAVVLSPAAAGRAGDHRLRARDRRHRRPGAVHAGRRQPAAGVARDRGPAAALRQAGRPGGVQVRRAG